MITFYFFMAKRLSEETVGEIYRLCEEGLSQSKIAERLDISQSTVSEYILMRRNGMILSEYVNNKARKMGYSDWDTYNLICRLERTQKDNVLLSYKREHERTKKQRKLENSIELKGLFNNIEDGEPYNPERLAEEKELYEEVLPQCLEKLTSRERIIIQRRYLGDGMTLKQVAEELGLTRERIRQIEARAIERLRYFFKSTDYDKFSLPINI